MAESEAHTVLGGDTTRTSPHIAAAMARLASLSLRETAALRSEIQRALDQCSAYLDEQGINMETPLVGPDGFPRGDIDVMEVTLTRRNAMRLVNDGRDVQERLRELLQGQSPLQRRTTGTGAKHISSDAKRNSTAAKHNSVSDSLEKEKTESPGNLARVSQGVAQLAVGPGAGPGVGPDANKPFARVSLVSPLGPAFRGGMRDGDLLLKLESGTGTDTVTGAASQGPVNVQTVTAASQDPLRQLQILVLRSEDSPQPLRATVLRGSDVVEGELWPHRGWGGAGLLGCKLDAMMQEGQ